MRAMFWLWMFTLCFNLTYVTIKNKTLTSFDSSLVTITLGLAAAKAGQRIWGEKVELSESEKKSDGTVIDTKTTIPIFVSAPFVSGSIQ